LFDYLPEQYSDAIRELNPTGENIMPLYVRAENPFDYQNDKQVRAIIQKLLDQGYLDPKSNKSLVFTKYLTKAEVNDLATSDNLSLTDIIYGNASNGNWGVIEQKPFQEAIKELGHDGFYVSEGGRKNLGIYKSEQVKSATGNLEGTFDRASGDIRYRRVTPVLTPAGQQAQAVIQSMGNISNAQPKQPQMSTMQKVGAFFFDPSLRERAVRRLRVEVASKGASIEDKLQKAWNGAIRNALGETRPDLIRT
jgi:hypothetical protein